MVLLHMKKSDLEQFLFETTVEASVKDTVEELVAVHNLRLKIQRLKIECEELGKYGAAKLPDKQGIDQYCEGTVEKGPHYTEDPTGRRTGNACAPETAQVLTRTCDEAEALAHKDQVTKKVVLTRKMLLDALDNVRGAIMICYPMGLPDWDLARLLLEDKEGGEEASYSGEVLDSDKTDMWFAGKQMMAGKQLKDFVGKHEKSKVIVKLLKKGAGAPSREPAVDQETQKAMMAHYYKKQEEQKKLVENEDDAYVHSSWANPKSLKSHFSGVGSVKLPK